MNGKDFGMAVTHCLAASMKADLLTKASDTTKFAVAVDMIGIRVGESEA